MADTRVHACCLPDKVPELLSSSRFTMSAAHRAAVCCMSLAVFTPVCFHHASRFTSSPAVRSGVPQRTCQLLELACNGCRHVICLRHGGVAVRELLQAAQHRQLLHTFLSHPAATSSGGGMQCVAYVLRIAWCCCSCRASDSGNQPLRYHNKVPTLLLKSAFVLHGRVASSHSRAAACSLTTHQHRASHVTVLDVQRSQPLQLQQM